MKKTRETKGLTVERAKEMLAKIDWSAHSQRVEAHMEKITEEWRRANARARETAARHVLL